ncbi:MAG: phosphate-binding protein PstS [Verrucomicrobiota bacterium]|jgi:phosphate transport system substrate-binding protein
MKINILSSFACLCLAAKLGAAQKVDADLPEYKPVAGLSGNLNSVGSDTLNNVMTFWAEGFRRQYPQVKLQIEGKGSATAPAALEDGTAQLGPMSREMKSTEADKFEKKFGYKPTAIGVAIDALAVYVHKDNPIKGMNLQQVDGIFSSTYKLGGRDISSWGDLGLDGELSDAPIAIFGRNSSSGTYGFFKETALGKGDFKSGVNEQPGSSGVISSVAKNKAGIGYSGIGYRTAEVRALPLADKDGSKYAEPSAENCLNKSYPLARVLFVYINKKPGQPADPLTAEFLRYALSKQGQELVAKEGFYSLPAAMSKKIELSLK